MFKSRKEAADQLSVKLEKYRNINPIVLAASREGVEVGYHISKYLDCDFSIIISKPLAFLKQPENNFGALAEDGSIYLDPEIRRKLTKEEIYKAIESREKLIKQNVQMYRNGQPLPALNNRIVILTDDALTTSSSELFAAIHMCKKQKPRNIVVAAPIADNYMIEQVYKKVSDVVAMLNCDNLYSVSGLYEDFNRLSDQDILSYLASWNLRNALKSLA